jgi:alkyl hydroperoxide reductase subunit AhpF
MTTLGDRERTALEEVFAGLQHDVPVRLELGPVETPVALLAAGGRELDACAETRTLVEEVAGLSPRIHLEVVERDEPGLYPALTLGEGLVYLGLPWGYELATLVHGIAAAGGGAAPLKERSLDRLAGLEHDVAIDVYVTPT